MAETRTVEDGQSILGLAAEKGLSPETIWQHPNNSSLRNQGRTPETLLDSVDQVYIPDIRIKSATVPVNRRTVFQRKGVTAMLRVRFADADDKPREGLKYLFEIDGQKFSGKTGLGGLVERKVPPGAKSAKLTLRNEQGRDEVYDLLVSCLDPATELCGAQQRLVSMGFDCGEEYGGFGPQTEQAIRAFQRKFGLTETGSPDSGTLSRIEQEYGS